MRHNIRCAKRALLTPEFWLLDTYALSDLFIL